MYLFSLQPQLPQRLLHIFQVLKHQLHRAFLFLLVDEHVGVLAVLLLAQVELFVEEVGGGLLATEALVLEVFQVETGHAAVVELQPLLLLGLDERVVVPELGGAVVGDHSHQHVLGVLRLALYGLFGHSAHRIRTQVELHRELQFCVDLLIDEGVVVEDNPIEMHDQYIGTSTNDCLLTDIRLLVAEPTPIIINNLPQNKLIKRLRQRLRTLDLHRQTIERLFSMRHLMTLIARQHITRLPTIRILKD